MPFAAVLQEASRCLTGIKVCASSLNRARELAIHGHKVELMLAPYVKPHVKRQKNDMADAEATCEAFTWPYKQFVAAKFPEQQSGKMRHKVRLILNRQLIMVMNAIRAFMAGFGLAAPV